MRILIVAATAGEAALLNTNHKTLVTGVGMVATACTVGRELAINNYDLAINMGVAGSFNSDVVS